MLEALKLAQNALDQQEVPSRRIPTHSLPLARNPVSLVGCVIVHKDSNIIASGQNAPVRLKNATRHAEMCALDTLFAQHDLPTTRQVRYLPHRTRSRRRFKPLASGRISALRDVRTLHDVCGCIATCRTDRSGLRMFQRSLRWMWLRVGHCTRSHVRHTTDELYERSPRGRRHATSETVLYEHQCQRATTEG